MFGVNFACELKIKCELAHQKFWRCIESGIAYTKLNECQHYHQRGLAASLASNNIAGPYNTIEDELSNPETESTVGLPITRLEEDGDEEVAHFFRNDKITFYNSNPDCDVVQSYYNAMVHSQDVENFSCESERTISSDSDDTTVSWDGSQIDQMSESDSSINESNRSTDSGCQPENKKGSAETLPSNVNTPSNYTCTLSRAVHYDVDSFFPEDTRSETTSMSNLQYADNFSWVPQSTNEPEAETPADQSASSDNDSETPPKKRRCSVRISSRFVTSNIFSKSRSEDNHCDVISSLELQDSDTLSSVETESTNIRVEPEPLTQQTASASDSENTQIQPAVKQGILNLLACDFCMRTFSRIDNLKRHMINIHKIVES